VVQVEPLKHVLKPPGAKRPKLKCDILLSTYAFNFNLRRYNVNRELVPAVAAAMQEGYTAGYEEKGTGSHRRRTAIIEAHVVGRCMLNR
jgi:hypothetical protein